MASIWPTTDYQEQTDYATTNQDTFQTNRQFQHTTTMELLIECFREFKEKRGMVQFGTLIRRLFFSSHGVFCYGQHRTAEN